MPAKKPKPRPHKHRPLRHSPPGAPPGTLMVDPSAPQPIIRVLAYDPETVNEFEVDDPNQLHDVIRRHRVTWVNVNGLGDPDLLKSIGEVFDLHPLGLEDVVNVHQRPKTDLFGDQLFIVFRAVRFDKVLMSEQISLFLGDGFVISFQEGREDRLSAIRERIHLKHGRIRDQGADYLAYAILDRVIDDYYPPLEEYGERLEDLEEEILTSPSRSAVVKIHSIKRELLNLRRTIWPMREMVNDLLRDPIPFFSGDTHLYLKDCYDHVIQIIDLVETDRELGSDLMDVYLTATSNRMNEIMKVLAIITTIFMPMSFIAGIYGMNFDPNSSPWNMPEVEWYWGYPFVLLLMIGVAAGLMALFRWRGWLEPLDVSKRPFEPQKPMD